MARAKSSVGVPVLVRIVAVGAQVQRDLRHSRHGWSRSVAGARRAAPRRIHGVRFAITATARSDRRIAVRGPGVGVDASFASAESACAPWRSTASSSQLPGTPRNSTLPRSSKPVPEPTTRSRTVRETRISPAPAWPRMRAAMWTASPPMSACQQFALAGVDARADLDAQPFGVGAQCLGAPDGLRRAVEGDEVAVAGALHHRAAESLLRPRR